MCIKYLILVWLTPGYQAEHWLPALPVQTQRCCTPHLPHHPESSQRGDKVEAETEHDYPQHPLPGFVSFRVDGAFVKREHAAFDWLTYAWQLTTAGYTCIFCSCLWTLRCEVLPLPKFQQQMTSLPRWKFVVSVSNNNTHVQAKFQHSKLPYPSPARSSCTRLKERQLPSSKV